MTLLNTKPPIRLGRSLVVHFEVYLLRHISFFRHPLGLLLDWELVDFVLQHPEFLKSTLEDSEDALHFEKVQDLETYLEIQER